MPTTGIEYILICDGREIQKPTKTFTINLPTIRVKVKKKKENKK